MGRNKRLTDTGEQRTASMRRLSLGPLTMMKPCCKKQDGEYSPRPSLKLFKHFRSSKSCSSRSVSSSSSASKESTPVDPNPNVIQFLTESCPNDILPKILAYAGPQKTAILSRVNRHFHTLVQAEGTWKVLCEELYKWKPGQDIPRSWKEYYCLHPCVPVDYPSVEAALSNATKKSDAHYHFGSYQCLFSVPCRNIIIYLRPGHYYMDEAVKIQADLPGSRITLETMELPDTFRGSNVMDETKSTPWEQRAILILKTRLRNEPLFRVARGELILNKISLRHNSSGIDIWSGNAAVHIQPDEQDLLFNLHPIRQRATVTFLSCEVVSNSGRGIVAVDGGRAEICDSYIHDCAATGVYIAGLGTCAFLHGSDVVGNGVGNQRTRGIARGHSGVYLERGSVEISNCNISRNSAAGISVVSPENTRLTLRHSDVLSNGCTPLEIPWNETHRPNVERNNNRISVLGAPRTRSSILLQAQRDGDL